MGVLNVLQAGEEVSVGIDPILFNEHPTTSEIWLVKSLSESPPMMSIRPANIAEQER